MKSVESSQDKAGVGEFRSSVDLKESITLGERRELTCSESERRSKGQGDGSQELPTPDKVRKLQITLYRKAKSDKRYRFWSLYGEILRPDLLETAWLRVCSNGGTAGVDGETIKEIASSPERTDKWLEALHKELQGKSYRPQAVRRVMIPKASGGERPLGIPTVKDRVVQMAVYLVLMPIFEADFHPFSFGFRPRRSAHQAIEAIREGLRTDKTEVVDADLSKYFDTIPHKDLLRQVAKRVSDGMVLKLIKQWLRAPIMEQDGVGKGNLKSNERGTPQGGVISPLLANIYLNPLDYAVNEKCMGKPRLIRYADDLVILCRTGEGHGLEERLKRWLESKGLQLNEKKTRLVDSRVENFKFLGFNFRRQRSRKGTTYVHAEVSDRNRQIFRDRIRGMLNRTTTWRPATEVIKEVNRSAQGWGNYFAYAHSWEAMGKMNHFLAHRLRQWLWRKHGNPSGKYKRWPDSALYAQYRLYKFPTHHA